MRFPVVESCDFAVVRALREAGFHVLAVSELSPRADDSVVTKLASQKETILLTEDKDFGQLVYAEQKVNRGVVLIRFPASVRAALPRAMLDLLNEHKDALYDRLTVLQPGQVRFGTEKHAD
jgi:predicted nuclease of predicted toxin-antitoxin system